MLIISSVQSSSLSVFSSFFPATVTSVEVIAAILFVVALLHTFSTKQFERLSHRYPRHAGLFHLLGEVEVVFGFWAMVLILLLR